MPNRDDELIGSVLSNAASQLRGSLGNIYSAFNRIVTREMREGNPELDKNAALLYQSYYRMLRLVNNLTNAAELYGQWELPMRNGDIVELCRRICREAAGLAVLQEQELVFLCEEEEHIVAMNADGMERLLLNLLSNAMKFTGRGGRITVGLRFVEDQVELSVSDTGCGISQELLPTLFDRYRHVERMDPAPHGLGLGLPICHHIAACHKGEIFAASTEGSGTSVTVLLPDEQQPTAQIHDIRFDYAGGFNHTLMELSDALPSKAFLSRWMD